MAGFGTTDYAAIANSAANVVSSWMGSRAQTKAITADIKSQQMQIAAEKERAKRTLQLIAAGTGAILVIGAAIYLIRKSS